MRLPTEDADGPKLLVQLGECHHWSLQAQAHQGGQVVDRQSHPHIPSSNRRKPAAQRIRFHLYFLLTILRRNQAITILHQQQTPEVSRAERNHDKIRRIHQTNDREPEAHGRRVRGNETTNKT